MFRGSIIAVLSILLATPIWARSSLGPSESVVITLMSEDKKEEKDCKDLKGGFAKIGVLPVSKTGVSAIAAYEEFLHAEPIPPEGMPFHKMTTSGPCYKNGKVPQKDEKDKQVYALAHADGHVAKISNCANVIVTDYVFLPKKTPPGLEPEKGEKGEKGDKGDQGERGKKGSVSVLGWVGIGIGTVGGIFGLIALLESGEDNDHGCTSCFTRR